MINNIMQAKKYFCLFGQVDTGKSTLAGRLIYECGQINEHEFDKHCKMCAGSEYALWSRILDIYEEERVRSKTFEYTTIDLKYNDKDYVLVDTPGHKTFIRSLIQAMSSYEGMIGCVLVSARKGEFESGWEQTMEDIILAKSIGIDQIIVLVNKMDTVDWDEKIYENIKLKTEKLLKMCKFESTSFIPVSGYNNLNLLKTDINFGNTISFMKALENINIDKNKNKNNINIENGWTEFVADIKIIDLPGSMIISPGFQCIAHYSGGEYTVNVDKIKGKTFIKKGDSATVKFTSQKEIIGKSDRVVFRLMDKTIGFGKIVKVLS